MKNRIHDIVKIVPSAETLWGSDHKIPWNDPAFSMRILKEHLSQDHHLASRKSRIIEEQAAWIHAHCLTTPSTILDLGCGPGLYAGLLAGDTHHYHGIDFSPASINYAQEQYAADTSCEFRLGDVTQADFGGPYDLVAMLYGELNVFSPEDCRRILSKAHAALPPGGRLLVEFQNPAAVQGVGEAPNSWTRADEGGLFSDDPYVCLTENHWFEAEGVALQAFHVMETNGEASTYRSTTKAWTEDEMKGLLTDAGFTGVQHHQDWPIPDDSLMLVSAIKS